MFASVATNRMFATGSLKWNTFCEKSQESFARIDPVKVYVFFKVTLWIIEYSYNDIFKYLIKFEKIFNNRNIYNMHNNNISIIMDEWAVHSCLKTKLIKKIYRINYINK